MNGSSLSDPRDRAAYRITAALAFLVPFAVYVATAARNVTFVDSGELAAAAATLGIAHPPGYPLFTLLGHLFSLLPFGTPFFRIALVSAAGTSLAAFFLHRAAHDLLESSFPEDGRARVARAVAPLGGAWVFAFARTPWGQAVTVEVYALQSLLAAAFFAACARGLVRPEEAGRAWIWAAFAVGLALTNHLTAFLLLPSLVVFLIATRRSVGAVSLRAAGLAAGALVAPLALYAYLPLRARMGPLVDWDHPASLHRFWVHVSARQYHGQLGREGLRFDELQRFASSQALAEAGAPLLVLAAVGLVFLFLRCRSFAILSAAFGVLAVLYNIAYPIRDIAEYYFSAVLVLGLWAAAGAGWVASILAVRQRTAGLVLAVLIAAVAAIPLRANYSACDQSRFELAERFVMDALFQAEPNAVFFSEDWESFTAPAMYYQDAEGIRPDVVVIDRGRVASYGLLGHLERRAPDLADAVREEARVVRRNVEASEKRLPIDVDVAREEYVELIRSLVASAVDTRPTYVLGFMHRDAVFDDYTLHPEGIVWRVTRSSEYRPVQLENFEGPDRSLGTSRNPKEREIVYFYSRMLRNRIQYLREHGRAEEASVLEAGLQRVYR